VSWLDLLALLAAGAAAGLINTVVGSGTLVTFPTLLALGVPPVTANVSNTIGLVPGGVSGALATRHALGGTRRDRLVRLGAASLVGGVVGALLLLRLPSEAFDTIVPVLIGIGCVLVVVQPWLARKVAARRELLGITESKPHGSVWLLLGVLLTGVYGGYFGAAQGVLLIGVLGIGLAEPLQRVNAIKNILAGLVNGVAGLLFILLYRPNWWAVGAIAIGSVIGAQIGGRVGRKLPSLVYRAVIVVIGVVAIVNLLRP
jgi:uncharacterized protein